MISYTSSANNAVKPEMIIEVGVSVFLCHQAYKRITPWQLPYLNIHCNEHSYMIQQTAFGKTCSRIYDINFNSAIFLPKTFNKTET
jgi:hypothetical protein